MTDDKHINERAEKALQSLDGISRAEVRPFLYTRVKARLAASKKTLWETAGSFLSRPVVAIASLCAILVFNGYVLFHQNKTTAAPETSKISGTAASNTMFTDNEYVLASSSSFDYENIDQQ